jgi:hypothetical protein
MSEANKYPVYSSQRAHSTGSSHGQGGFQFFIALAGLGGGYWIYTMAQETGEKIVERLPYQVIPSAELGRPDATAADDLAADI